MKLIDVLAKWFGMAGPELRALFVRLRDASPDAAASIDAILAKLDQAATFESISALAGFLLTEGPNIAQLKFKGEPHPSDLA